MLNPASGVDGRSFVVGPALRQLAFDALNRGAVRGLRHAVRAELVAQVGETCNFTALDGTQVLYRDRVEARWPLRLTLDVGAHLPLHSTASGKLFLAQMPGAARDALIVQLPLPRVTRNTIVSAKRLRAEGHHTAERSDARDREEFIAWLIAVPVPVPVRRSDGVGRAGIAVHAPVAWLALADAVAQLPALQAAAARMRAFL